MKFSKYQKKLIDFSSYVQKAFINNSTLAFIKVFLMF